MHNRTPGSFRAFGLASMLAAVAATSVRLTTGGPASKNRHDPYGLSVLMGATVPSSYSSKRPHQRGTAAAQKRAALKRRNRIRHKRHLGMKCR